MSGLHAAAGEGRSSDDRAQRPATGSRELPAVTDPRLFDLERHVTAAPVAPHPGHAGPGVRRRSPAASRPVHELTSRPWEPVARPESIVTRAPQRVAPTPAPAPEVRPRVAATSSHPVQGARRPSEPVPVSFRRIDPPRRRDEQRAASVLPRRAGLPGLLDRVRSGSARPGRRRRARLIIPIAITAPILATMGIVQGVVHADAAVGNGSAWTQDFAKDVPLGQVSTNGEFPGYSDLWAYRDGLGDGKYQPSKVNSIENGVLTWHVPGGGIGSSVTIGRSAVGGEWSVRMRTDLISGMHIADMRWPDNNQWPGTDGSGGEIDYPEEDLSSSYPYAAVVGNAGETRNGSQLFNPPQTTRVPKPWTEWHTYTTQVDPGKSIVMYQDGVEVARVTENVPRTAIHEQFQVEPKQAGSGGTGTVQVSAVSYSPSLDLSTLANVGGQASSGASVSSGGASASSHAPASASDPASTSPSAGAAPESAAPSASSSRPSTGSTPDPSATTSPLGTNSLFDSFTGDSLDRSRWDTGAPSSGCRMQPAVVKDGAAEVSATNGCAGSTLLQQAVRTDQSYGYFEADLDVSAASKNVRLSLAGEDADAPTVRIVDGFAAGHPCFAVADAGDDGRWCATGSPVTDGTHTFGAMVTKSAVTFYLDHVKIGRWRGTVADTARTLRIGMRGTTGGTVVIDRVAAWRLATDRSQAVPSTSTSASASTNASTPVAGCPVLQG